MRILTTRQAAEKIGRTYDWFLRNRKTLEAERGFPAPIAGLNRYDAVAIDRWIDAQLAEARLAHSGRPAALDIEEELARRAERLAAGVLH